MVMRLEVLLAASQLVPEKLRQRQILAPSYVDIH